MQSRAHVQLTLEIYVGEVSYIHLRSFLIRMKQRVTYFLPEGARVDPQDIHVTNDSLTFARAKDAAIEKKVTAGLSELPEEVGYPRQPSQSR